MSEPAKIGMTVADVYRMLLESIETVAGLRNAAETAMASIRAYALVSTETLDMLYEMHENEQAGMSSAEALKKARGEENNNG